MAVPTLPQSFRPVPQPFDDPIIRESPGGRVSTINRGEKNATIWPIDFVRLSEAEKDSIYAEWNATRFGTTTVFIALIQETRTVYWEAGKPQLLPQDDGTFVVRASFIDAN